MNAEMLDKIQELRMAYPQAEVVFFANTNESGEYDYIEHQIKKVLLEEVASYTEKLLVGEGEILEYLEDYVFDNNLNIDAETMLDNARKSGIVKDVILVYTGV